MAGSVPGKPGHVVTLTTVLATQFYKFLLQGLESKVYVFHLYIFGMVPGTQKMLNKPWWMNEHVTSPTVYCQSAEEPSWWDGLTPASVPSRLHYWPGSVSRAAAFPSHVVLTSFSRSSSVLNLACSSTWVWRRFFSSSAARDAASSSFYPIKIPHTEKQEMLEWKCIWGAKWSHTRESRHS